MKKDLEEWIKSDEFRLYGEKARFIKARLTYLTFVCSNKYANQVQYEEFDKLVLMESGRHDMRPEREKEYFSFVLSITDFE